MPRSISILTVCLLLILFISGCVPNRKLIYLQPADEEVPASREYYTPPYEYLLKPGDVISLDVFSLTDADLNFLSNVTGGNDSQGYMVNRYGDIRLPVINDIRVAGLNIESCQDSIQAAFAEHLVDPVVRIKLVSFEYTVMGEVYRPGTYQSSKPELNIFEAFAQAGDLRRFADRSRIKLVRTTEAQTTQLTELSLLSDTILDSHYYYVQPGDVLIVDPLKARETRQDQLVIFSTFVGILSTLALLYNTLTR